MSSLQFISGSYLPSRDVDYRSTPAAGTFYRTPFSHSLEKPPNCFSPGTGVSLERDNAVK
jgi:hypothetical protein